MCVYNIVVCVYIITLCLCLHIVNARSINPFFTDIDENAMQHRLLYQCLPKLATLIPLQILPLKMRFLWDCSLVSMGAESAREHQCLQSHPLLLLCGGQSNYPYYAIFVDSIKRHQYLYQVFHDCIVKYFTIHTLPQSVNL